MDTLLPLAKKVGEKLKARKETVGVSESSHSVSSTVANVCVHSVAPERT